MDQQQYISAALNDNRSTMMDAKRQDTIEGEEDLAVRIDDYAFEIFEKVRQISGIKNEDVVHSFDPEKNHRIFKKQLNEKGAGKSGKQIIQTHDRRFIVKEIDSIEKA